MATKVREVAYVGLEAVLAYCCGLDVHKKRITACLLIGPVDEPPKELLSTFSTTTKGLTELRDWLASYGCTHVAMESTGIFWRPVFNILEGTVTILLANARHMKQLPGRKTDINDAQWIARLLRWGLLKPSLIPPKPIRELREMCRYRKKLTQEVAAEKNRVHKTLEDANIKIASVATEIFGVSGLAMMDALIAGHLSPQETAELARGRMRSKIPELAEALVGNVEEHHKLLLRKHLDHLSYLQQAIAEMNRLIEEKTRPYQPQIDLLRTIPGIDSVAAQQAFAEMGGDITIFPSEDHFASWIGICPGNNESAGKQRKARALKGNRWLGSLLVQSAYAVGRMRETYAGAFYHRIARRRGNARAAVATGHYLSKCIYHVLKNEEPYHDLGADHLNRCDNDTLKKQLLKRLERLGYQVELIQQTSANN
ncbi:MAG: IS110 family transposase [Candidatus Omnitrophica bacterium]|nr:IS110 family transposase [Candidatus Omnitrophota bacterium]